MLPLLESAKLLGKRNLLAFSGGIDSVALFFLLQEQNITFDIAIVDYALREQSKDEVAYAKELSQKFTLKYHEFKAPKIEKNFEHSARAIRYNFFEELISKYNYENLITAHHLGDKLEWFLMQLTKGSGLLELFGMQSFEQRECYNIIRPLLDHTKDELLSYLNDKKITYFIDESNFDESYKRNYFRHNFSNPLLLKFSNGIRNSFKYLQKDVQILLSSNQKIVTVEDLAYIKIDSNLREAIFEVDKYLKSMGYKLSSSEKKALLEAKTLQVGRTFDIVFDARGFVFILKAQNYKTAISKEFKEECRVLKIDPILRSYLFTHKKAFEDIKELLG